MEGEKVRMTLQEIYDRSKRIVFFGGAGVSTESGIKDFRSADGLYHMKYAYPPEEILSHSFFNEQPEEFFRFYRDRILVSHNGPNAAHKALAVMEAKGKLSAIVMQNIDGLHQAAGSRHVLELHGSIMRNYCLRCRRFYGPETIIKAGAGSEEVSDSEAGADYEAGTDSEAGSVPGTCSIARAKGIPLCTCGGRIKPDVVLYEEPLDEKILDEAVSEIASADTLIVGGTSLVVYPAAGLLRYFRGQYLVLINKEATPADRSADLVIHDAIGKVLGELKL